MNERRLKNAASVSTLAQVENGAPVHIAFAVDSAFLSYSAIALWSAASNTRNLHVHVIHGGDLGAGVRGLKRIVERFEGRIQFYEACVEKLAGLPVTDHVSIATYYRLSIAELLPKNVQRVIYLDGDLIVRRPLNELYHWSLDPTGVAAVPEPSVAVSNLGMPLGTPYLNAGVLVLDLEQWRQKHVTARLFQIAADNKDRLRFWDQDVLALYLQGSWSFLPPHWNVHHRYFFGENKLPWPEQEPAIVHFSGAGLKPPDYKVLHPYAAEFWQIAKEVANFGFKINSPSRLRTWALKFRHWRSQLKTGSNAARTIDSRIAS